MIGGIVHHQYHSSGWVLLYQLFFQKVDKCCAILGFGNCPSDRVSFPVVAAKNMLLLFFARLCGWNPLLLSNFHPAGTQDWIKR